MNIPALPAPLVAELVRMALAEDLGGAGDITTDATIDPAAVSNAVLAAREPGIVAGMDFARAAFAALDPDVTFLQRVADGDRVVAGQVLAAISGTTRALLTGERVALNFLAHLSGVATLTRQFADAVEGTGVRIAATRKTLPGLRAPQKWAVRVGGGDAHRFGLDDAVLIKDNHLAASGSIAAAIGRARAYAGHMIRVACEVDTLEQLDAALEARADVVLLDNMDPVTLAEAVTRTAGRAVLEASGGVSLQTVRAIAESGVGVISVGRLTHSAPSLDLGLDFT